VQSGHTLRHRGRTRIPPSPTHCAIPRTRVAFGRTHDACAARRSTT
jgi:hypothetical protein